MGKFLSCGLIAAFAILPFTIKACAEPPPAEPVVESSGFPSQIVIKSINSQKQITPQPLAN